MEEEGDVGLGYMVLGSIVYEFGFEFVFERMFEIVKELERVWENESV